MTDLNTKINDLEMIIGVLVKTLGEVKQMVAVPAQQTTDINALAAMMNNQVPQAAPAAVADAPELVVKLAFWKKPNSFSGRVTILDGPGPQDKVIAEYNAILFLSKPNADSLVLNGYIRPKDAGRDSSLAESAVGSIYVHNNNGSLEAICKVEPSSVNDLFQWKATLVPVQKVSENQPDLESKSVVVQHFYSAQVRAQLQAQPVPQMSGPLADLFSSNSGPADGGILTNPMSDIHSLLG